MNGAAVPRTAVLRDRGNVMGFQTLLSMVESYISLKNELRPRAAASATDWDCGLAAEFESDYADASRRERLEASRAALERALDEYIEERIRAVLSRSSATMDGVPPGGGTGSVP